MEEAGEGLLRSDEAFRTFTLIGGNVIARIKSKRFIQCIFVLLLILGLLATSIGCGHKGLVTEKYPRDFYRVLKLLPDGPMEKNPKFIYYGDNRPGSRLKEKFLWKKNWLTWKMLIFPFYEAYWLGNGIVGGIGFLRHTSNYGVQERRMVRDAMYEEGKRSKVDFILHGGDMVGDGRRPSHWARFLRENKIERPLVSDFPFLPVAGSHEKANDPKYGLPNYEAIFEYPRFYVLDFPDAAFFVIDSDVILDQAQFIDDDEQDNLFQEWFVSGEDSEQPSWLERELASRNQHFKIVVMHHPLVSFAKHHTDWTRASWGRNLQWKRQQLLKLFHEQGVQAVLCGHEHLYEHSIVRYSSHANQPEHGIHIIVSGGGGVPLRPRSSAKKLEKFVQNYRAEGLDVVLVKQEEIYHYCLVDIDSDKVAIQILAVTGDPTQPVRLADEILIPKQAEALTQH